MYAHLAGAVLLLCLTAGQAEARSRAQKHWGGADFPFSCAIVRDNRVWIEDMSPEARSALARQFNITRKQRRQAYACLRGR